jgi:hypothetical protein
MTDKRLPFFHCYPDKWLNALASMKPDAGYVYLIICFRIYEKRGAIPDTLQALGKRTGYRPTHVERILKELIRDGKLTGQIGALENPFAMVEIERGRRKHHREIYSTTGNKTAEITQENQQTELPYIESIEDRSKILDSSKRAPRRSMAENWQPTQDGIRYATERKFDKQRISQMIRACRDYHIRRGTLIAGERGLAATWRTWVENEIKFSEQRKAGGADPDRWMTSAERYLKKQREGRSDGENQTNGLRQISESVLSRGGG